MRSLIVFKQLIMFKSLMTVKFHYQDPIVTQPSSMYLRFALKTNIVSA